MLNNYNKTLGLIASGIILLIILSAISSLFFINNDISFTNILKDSYIRHITYFSFMQASISTFLSVLFAIPLSLALYRREFWGKKWLLRLFSMTFVLPILVAVFGIVAIYGNSGILNKYLGEYSFNIYGLNGILLAHIFFNLPLACKVIYQSLTMIDTQYHKLSTYLGLNAYSKFIYIEWPIIKQQLTSLLGLIFMLCFTSFAIVMALGGGPKSTTIEVAIYQAIRYDFDLNMASLLAILQILICSFIALFMQKYSKTINNKSFYDTNKCIYIDNKPLKFFDTFIIFISVIFILPPLLAVVYEGLNQKFFESILNIELLKAIKNSFAIATASAFISMILGLVIILGSREYKLEKSIKKANYLELSANIILLTPSLVISTGLFILLNKYFDVFSYAFYFIVIINALMALPFIIRSLSQAFFTIAQEYNFLSKSLGISGFSRLILVEFKALKKPLANAIGLSFILSLGDLSAIALFGSPDYKTLPLLLYQQMGSYQMQEAAVSALVLLIFSLTIYTIIEILFTKKVKSVRNKKY